MVKVQSNILSANLKTETLIPKKSVLALCPFKTDAEQIEQWNNFYF